MHRLGPWHKWTHVFDKLTVTDTDGSTDELERTS